MIKFDVSVSGNNGGISIILEEDEKSIEAFVSLRGEGKESYLKVSESIVESDAGVFIEPEKGCKIEFSNVDNKIILKLNNSVVFSPTYDTDLSSLKDQTRSAD